MGIYDRDYHRADPPRRGTPAQGIMMRAPGWTVTTWLIVINIAVHVLAVTVFASRTGNPLTGGLYAFGSLSVEQGFMRLEVWRLITFQFLHDPYNGIFSWHLILNCFGLWVFGPMVEQHAGRKKYLAFYLVCGLAGGLLFVILSLLGYFTNGALPGFLTNSLSTPLIGASAGVFGVIMGSAYIAPNMTIQLLFPPIPMKLKVFAYGYVALALFQLLAGSHNAGGEAAHVGGAIAGYIFIRNTHLLHDFFDVFNDSRKEPGARKQRKQRRKGAPSDDQIDKILEKVSRSGIQSLTEKEKKLLSEASRDQRHAG
jgi:membrane associated rhomboid family serine protease